MPSLAKLDFLQICRLSLNIYNNTLRKFTNSATVSSLEQVQHCNPRIDQSADNITGLKCAKECLILKYSISRIPDAEVNNRIAKASAAFGRLRCKVWERDGITLDTKLKVYRAIVMPTLLYGCETWTVYQRHARTLNRFHLNCLRKILRIRWQDKIPDTTFSLAPTWWVSIPYWWNINSDGPVMWSEWKTLVFQNSSSLVNCTLGKGHVVLLRNASRILWKLLSNASMLIQRTWELQDQQRDSWRSTITNSALSYEAKRILQAESKRQERKSRIANANTTTTANSSSGVTCLVCHRSFRAKIGLISHMRTHNSTTS